MTQNESTIKLKQNKVMLLAECVDMNKTQFARSRALPTILQPEYIEGKWTIRHDINISLLEKGMLIKMI